MNDSISRDELALHGGDGHIMELTLQAHGCVQIFDDEHVIQKTIRQLLHARFGTHFIDGPGDAALWHELAVRHSTHGGKIMRQ